MFSPPQKKPKAEKHSTTRHFHGHALHDAYAWLRAENWQEVLQNPKKLPKSIRAYLEAENAYQEAAFAPLKDQQKQLVAEMRARIVEDDSSVPARDGDYMYYTRFREGGQHALICRHAVHAQKPDDDSDILLDADALAKGKAYFDQGEAAHSPNHALLAYSFDDKGSEYHTIRVKDLKTGKNKRDIVKNTSGAVVWDADSMGFFYVELNDNHRPKRVKYHRLGTSTASDHLVYEESDDGWFVGIGENGDSDFLEISTHDHQTSESWFLSLKTPLEKPFCLAGRTPEVEYSVEYHPDGQRLFILSNHNGAEDFAIYHTTLERSERAHWQPLIPHRQGCLILSHMLLKDYLIRMEREDGLPRIVVLNLASIPKNSPSSSEAVGQQKVISFDEEAYSLGVIGGYEFDTHTLRFAYNSMTTPSEVWDEDLRTGARTLMKRQQIPSGHQPSDYITRRIFATASDGERVPISLVYHKNTPLDGTAPCLLYGYGAYGMSMSASFSTTRLSLINRGFVFAIAHIRGGMEKGYRWYRLGRNEHKTNTFNDFIAAAESLCQGKYTTAGRIVAHGGSAGGMLMGAVANMRPDLFAGIIADVPFVDVMNTMLDDTLPLTPPEWPEWGNPIVDETAYQRILSYSPYDNVRPQAYPSMLVLAGLTDPRVTYWEAAKWMARLRENHTGAAPLFLRTNMDAGHGGASGRFDHLEEVALGQVFALTAVQN